MLEMAFEIIKTIQTLGHIAYVSGNSCRDICLKKEPLTWNISTTASPDEVEGVLVKLHLPFSSKNKKYGEIKAKLNKD